MKQYRKALGRLAAGEHRMCVPPQPDDDDMVISRALDEYELLLRGIEYYAEVDKHMGFTTYTNDNGSRAREILNTIRNGKPIERSSGITQLVREAHQNAISKGWWDEDRSFGEIISLMHSELSEALEDFRAGKQPNQAWYEGKNSKGMPMTSAKPMPPYAEKPCGIPSELADVVIRVFDASGRYGIDLEKAIAEKMAYNATRPHKHGGKVI